MIPVYLYKCMEWSDGEDHLEEDHNSYYDFEYIVLHKNPWNTYILSIPEAIVLCSQNPLELESNDIVRELSDKEVYLVLNRYRPCRYNLIVQAFKKTLILT